jgi:membrane-associated protein
LDWLDAQSIIDTFGDWAVLAVVTIIFLETAFIFTSFLPGDSLLFIIGLTLSVGSGVIPDWLGFILIWLAAFGGTQLGWYVGYKIGPPLFERRENIIFNKKVVETTRKFFDKYGVRAIILARFVPIIRALVPMFAGISRVEFGRFTRLNAIGATLWLAVFMVPGYFLGNLPLVKENLETAVLIVIIVSSLPFPLEILRTVIQNRRAKKKQEKLDAEYEIAEGYTDPEKLPKKD